MAPLDWREARDREFERVMRANHVPPRRSQVARLICGAYADKSIAQELGMSVSAVKKHKCLLFEMFDVHDRESLARAIRRLMGDRPMGSAPTESLG